MYASFKCKKIDTYSNVAKFHGHNVDQKMSEKSILCKFTFIKSFKTGKTSEWVIKSEL